MCGHVRLAATVLSLSLYVSLSLYLSISLSLSVFVSVSVCVSVSLSLSLSLSLSVCLSLSLSVSLCLSLTVSLSLSLQAMTEAQKSRVTDLIIGKEGFGEVQWRDHLLMDGADHLLMDGAEPASGEAEGVDLSGPFVLTEDMMRWEGKAVRALHFPLSHSFPHTNLKSPCAEQGAFEWSWRRAWRG